MALKDLINFDLLDLLWTSQLSEEKRGRLVYDYMLAYAGFVSEKVADRLTDEDEVAMSELLTSPDVNPEKIEQFYRDRIPNFDSLLLAATLLFKKDFVLDYYKTMMQETVKRKDPSAATWINIVAKAEEDRWDMVATLIKQIDQTYSQNQVTA